ncbi:MAG: FABP family protein [Epsilonproteobacteria bacterium]|nr:MAG: FABP family protein [Campylobacterota bacterium]RLA66750.1 MAG: FABP family protein [Campylobacterota bacterium]
MTDEEIKNLGPLASLVGTWEGDSGIDTAPAKDLGVMETPYRERLVFDPLSPVENHQQKLFGLRYQTTVWPIGAEDPFHEELGYWLWDPKALQVMKCFMVPRGVTVIAGGSASPDSTILEMKATLGSQTFGICSNPFLDENFQTEIYTLKITKYDDNSFSYEEDTQLKIPSLSGIFHHTDKNTLNRVN